MWATKYHSVGVIARNRNNTGNVISYPNNDRLYKKQNIHHNIIKRPTVLAKSESRKQNSHRCRHTCRQHENKQTLTKVQNTNLVERTKGVKGNAK